MEANTEERKATRSVVLFALAAVVLVLGLWFYTKKVLEDLKPEDRGTYGDMFGSVNALFSGLAFAGVIVAILLQREELRLQRKELKETRQEFRQQNETLKQQRFENTFFNAVGLYNEILRGMLFTHAGHQWQGRMSFQLFYHEFQSHYATVNQQPSMSEVEKVRVAYASFFSTRQSYIGPYFRTLYNIVKLVNTSDVVTKQIYVNMLRAQLSVDELALLFYNCLSDLGVTKFKPLVEQFALLETLPPGILLSEAHKSLYNSGAFEERQS